MKNYAGCCTWRVNSPRSADAACPEYVVAISSPRYNQKNEESDERNHCREHPRHKQQGKLSNHPLPYGDNAKERQIPDEMERRVEGDDISLRYVCEDVGFVCSSAQHCQSSCRVSRKH